MKEVTGELNATLITVMAVAMLAVFFFSVLWPMMKDNLETSAKCSDAVCDVGYNSNKMSYCYTPDPSNVNAKADYFECPFRG